jgi:hypothetical protein
VILNVVAKAGNECTLEKIDQREPRKAGTEILKVYKNENFFGFDFEFCTISLLVMLGPLWREIRLFRVVIRLRGIKIVFNLGQNNFLFFNHI